AGLDAARAARHENVISGPRTLGFGLIKAEEPFDGQRFLVAVTDGERDAAITVTLTGTLVAVLDARKEDAAAHALDRVARASGGIKGEHGYVEVLLAHHTYAAY